MIRLAAKNACSQLEYLDLTGCRFITDVGLERLGACFRSKFGDRIYNYKCGSCCQTCERCPSKSTDVGIHSGQQGNRLLEDEAFSPGLSYLSISGCTSVTDFGLRSLLEVTLQMNSLSFLDLSGCSRVSGAILNAITEYSTRLLPQDLYYCNTIQEGPYPDEANGCQNLECPIRGCCCFDQ